MNELIVGLAIVVGAIIGPLLINRQLNSQRKAQAVEKAADRKREDQERKEAKEERDAVAAEALRAQEELAAETARQQKLISDAVEEAAKKLAESEKERIKGTDEVARLAAGETPSYTGVPVVISYESTGQRETVFLSSVPAQGETIRLKNGIDKPSLIVVAVVWMEAALPPPHPSVIIVVRPVVASDNVRDKEVKAHEISKN